MKPLCECCSEQPSQMDFNCWMPSFGEMVEADVCLDCWEEAFDDTHLAVKVVMARAFKAGKSIPMSMEALKQFFKRQAAG